MLIIRVATVCLLCCFAAGPLTADVPGLTLSAKGREQSLGVFSPSGTRCLDLGELARKLEGSSLSWEILGERIVWRLDGRELVFEDGLAVFLAGGDSYQLTDQCRVYGQYFLLPMQLAVEYLPRLFPQRFSYNKLENKLKDNGPAAVALGKPGAGKTAAVAEQP